MMALRFYNTLAGKVEEFQSLEDKKVRIYTCGPTVYGYAHIGNYRTFVFQDILRRFLKYQSYEVLQVTNLTDVDDKTIRNAKAAGLSLRDYTDRFIEAFDVDRKLLNLERPEIVVRATDYIGDMVKLIQTLEQKGYAYKSQGSYYFRVEKFPDYGKLSRIDLSGMRAGARVDADEYDKANVRDFVLWKAAKEGEPSWDTPLGPGRPGWHIECSVMSMKYLGDTFDIHSGGVDLIFPHHENEIAQSEAATGKPFVRYWLHSEHLVINGEKMSKSLGNVYTLRDLIAEGHRPSAIRYLLASVPYRSLLNFTFDGLHQARQSVERLRNFRYRLTKEEFPPGRNAELEELAAAARRKFEEAMADNLNTAEALAAIFEMVREGNTAMDHGKFLDGSRGAFLDTLGRWDQTFAVLEDNDLAKLRQFGLLKGEQPAPEAGGEPVAVLVETLGEEEIEKLLSERETARRQRNFARADQIRDELQNGGVLVEDTKAGTRWKRI
ncbi:MAG TPA: cysteine--tRNA ligase [Terriglobia bacterium]|nr:cysteine--tRNA ligase [Terriglobia bacterium]